MNKKALYFVLALLLLILSFFAGRYSVISTIPNTPVNDTIAPKIEKIIIKNDSLLRINDSINLKVIEIEKTYETTVDDIIRNNTTADYDFFSTYINRYCGYNNFDTTQNGKFNIRRASDVEE